MPTPKIDLSTASRATPTSIANGNVVRDLNPVDLARLQHLTGYPMVSVVLATRPGPRLDNVDGATIERLIDHAERRLTIELAGHDISEVIEPLRQLRAQIADEPAGLGLALFSGAGVIEAYRLPLGPVARVVVDPTFATRDLARAVLENPPYRLLSLSAGTARLYIGTGALLDHLVGDGFPMSEDPAPDDRADRRGHLHQGERTHRNPRRWDRFLREVDHALAADHRRRDLPLILAAAEPIASLFQNRAGQPIIGTVAGNHQRTGRARLAELARPVIDAHLDRERQQALDRLEAATDRRRAVYGVSDVWRAALDRRVQLLLVDPDYVYPAVPAPDGRSLTPALDPEHPDALDDAVDEIIELVARRGGDACFTPLQQSSHGIAAVLGTT